MSLRLICGGACVFHLMVPVVPVGGTEWHVDGAATISGDGTSWETAFRTIQEGIRAASNGDTVIVAEGTYRENIHFYGKNVVLRSMDPLDASIVSKTIVDGEQKGAVITFSGTEGPGWCMLSGFSIRNGKSERAGGICGGTFRVRTHATIQNNRITGNATRWGSSGAGAAFCNGLIQNNIVSENWGGGLAYCDGTIQYNSITNNRARAGALYRCDGTIRWNIVSGNSTTGNGGGLEWCDGVVESNTIYGNSADWYGGGIYRCNGTIRNCIIWGNRAYHGNRFYHGLSQVAWSSTPTHCCIQRWSGGGTGNISAYAYFVDPDAGDFHLRSWSPCIDAGDPASDFSREPSPNGGRINMGAYGNTPEAASASQDSDHDLLPDDWEIQVFGNLAQEAAGDWDGDRRPNLKEYLSGADPTHFATWYVDASAAVSGKGTSWASAFKTIQEGIDASQEWDIVTVAEGTYLENIDFRGKSITVASIDPVDPAVVAATVIDGGANGPVVTFGGTEDESCALCGFTIRNGEARFGGGILGSGTQATIRNNNITANRATQNGGGVAFCDGLIRNNAITANRAGHGGGLYVCGGTIDQNVVSGNSVEHNGGGLFGCDGAVQRNTISDNSADGVGGGLHNCDGTLRNNLITRNNAGSGGGLSHCYGTIQGNIFCANWARHSGGGLAYCRAEALSNTIADNVAAGRGGGLHTFDGKIVNCILWGNTAVEGPQLSDSDKPRFSCVEGWSGEGVGNISDDPLFFDVARGDYHLRPESPCINAGTNSFADWFWTDRDGDPRIIAGRVDMGADEYWSGLPEQITWRSVEYDPQRARLNYATGTFFVPITIAGPENTPPASFATWLVVKDIVFAWPGPNSAGKLWNADGLTSELYPSAGDYRYKDVSGGMPLQSGEGSEVVLEFYVKDRNPSFVPTIELWACRPPTESGEDGAQASHGPGGEGPPSEGDQPAAVAELSQGWGLSITRAASQSGIAVRLRWESQGHGLYIVEAAERAMGPWRRVSEQIPPSDDIVEWVDSAPEHIRSRFYRIGGVSR